MKEEVEVEGDLPPDVGVVPRVSQQGEVKVKDHQRFPSHLN